MPSALVIEDNAADVRQVSTILNEIGFDQIDLASTVPTALHLLDEVVEKKRPAPDLMVLDLSFGYESGFEVLRRWKSDQRLKPIRVIVWTQMGEREQELCRLFGLQYVIPKWKGNRDLKLAVQKIMGGSQGGSQPPSEASL